MSENYNISEERLRQLCYPVTVNYHIQDVDNNGLPIEVELKDQTIWILKFQNRNKSHGKFVMELLKSGRRPEERDGTEMDSLDIAEMFARFFIYDEKVRKNILEDWSACVSLFASKEVRKEVDDFLDSWDLTKPVVSDEVKSL